MNLLILGGDFRYFYTAEKLGKLHTVQLYGIESNNTTKIIPLEKPPEKKSDALILPIPFTVDNENINAPYMKDKIPLSSLSLFVKEKGIIFSGRTSPYLENYCEKHNIKLINYFNREELAILNAIPTAEATLEIAIRETKRTLFGMKVLLTGYGRISRIMLKYLLALGADVTVVARKAEQIAWATADGAHTISFSQLKEKIKNYQMIINTAPSLIITSELIERLNKNTLIIDLASKSGIDLKAAKQRGVKAIWALSLPGKSAPVSAGEIIADTILNIISEGVD